MESLAQKRRGEVRWLGERVDNRPWLYLPSDSPYEKSPKLYVSTGIHGDEPSGPRAILELLQEGYSFKGVELFLFPILNPRGMSEGSRETPEGVDLNRDYLNPQSPETSGHLEVIEKLPRVDAALCLHEDWESLGVYLFALNLTGNLGCHRSILNGMAEHLPVDESEEIDGFEADLGIIERDEKHFDRPDWPEAVWLCTHLTDLCYTVETPSSFPLVQRAKAHAAAVRCTVDYLMSLE